MLHKSSWMYLCGFLSRSARSMAGSATPPCRSHLWTARSGPSTLGIDVDSSSDDESAPISYKRSVSKPVPIPRSVSHRDTWQFCSIDNDINIYLIISKVYINYIILRVRIGLSYLFNLFFFFFLLELNRECLSLFFVLVFETVKTNTKICLAYVLKKIIFPNDLQKGPVSKIAKDKLHFL